MELQDIKDRVAELAKHPYRDGLSKNGWYQEIELFGVQTTRNSLSNMSVWNRIRSLLPSHLYGMGLLDIGCNAGLFCTMAAMEGAVTVGLDNKQCWVDQAIFVHEMFEARYGKRLSSQFKLFDVATNSPCSLGAHFDYTLLIGVAAEIMFVHGERKFSPLAMGAQEVLITRLTGCTDNMIIRSRETQSGMSSVLYTEIMNKCNWTLTKQIQDVNENVLLNLYSRSDG